MARLTIVDPAQATGETKELFDSVKASMGAIPNMTKALANSPAALRAFLDLHSAVAGCSLDGAVLERRGQVSDEDLDRVRAAGYSDGELAEIVANVALNTLTNYFNRMAAPDLEFAGVEPAAIAA